MFIFALIIRTGFVEPAAKHVLTLTTPIVRVFSFEHLLTLVVY